MEGEGELRGGMLKAAMGAVTCHGGMGLRYALGMAELVREHVVQRVLRAGVGSVIGAACVREYLCLDRLTGADGRHGQR